MNIFIRNLLTLLIAAALCLAVPAMAEGQSTDMNAIQQGTEGFDVPPVPEEAVRLTGGIPKYADDVKSRYDLSETEALSEQLSPLAGDMWKGLVEEGAFTIPTEAAPESAWLYYDDANGELMEVPLILTRTDEGIVARLVSQVLENSSELRFCRIESGDLATTLASDGLWIAQTFATDAEPEHASDRFIVAFEDGDIFYVTLRYGDHEWNGYYDFRGEIFDVTYS